MASGELKTLRWPVLYVATTNAGKLRDFAAAAELFAKQGEPQLSGIVFLPLPNLDGLPEAVEDGATFLTNAIRKAEHYSLLAPGLTVLADDSGLEVHALGGAPGVRSARFAADAGMDEPALSRDSQNNLLLMERLYGVPAPRPARYVAALAVARNGICEATAEGTVAGEILTEARGSGGFGYDPLFWLPELGKTMAEIDLATKQRISHRGNALRKLLVG